MHLTSSIIHLFSHFEAAYSLLPRLSTTCSPGQMQLAMTHEGLTQCLVNRKDDYCFAFVTTSFVPSKKVIIATPDFAVNQKEFVSAVFGLVFPFWPMFSTTLLIPQPKFQSDLTLADPYNRVHLLASYLGHLGDASYRTPKVVESLSRRQNVSITIVSASDIICFPNGLPLMDVKPQFLPCSLSKDVCYSVVIFLMTVHLTEGSAPNLLTQCKAQTHSSREAGKRSLSFSALAVPEKAHQQLWTKAEHSQIEAPALQVSPTPSRH